MEEGLDQFSESDSSGISGSSTSDLLLLLHLEASLEEEEDLLDLLKECFPQ